MSLTMATGPLAASASERVNYRIDAPEHRLFFDPFPRRVRAVFAGDVADVAWRFPERYPDAAPVAGYWCFGESKVTVEYDTRTAPAGSHRQRVIEPHWL
jgi:hypothetical protein